MAESSFVPDRDAVNKLADRMLDWTASEPEAAGAAVAAIIVALYVLLVVIV